VKLKRTACTLCLRGRFLLARLNRLIPKTLSCRKQPFHPLGEFSGPGRFERAKARDAGSGADHGRKRKPDVREPRGKTAEPEKGRESRGSEMET